MAVTESYISVYSKAGVLIAVIYDYDTVSTNPTIGDLLNTSACKNNGITELSATQGGAALDHSLRVRSISLEANGDNLMIYDATPDIPDIALRIHNTRIRR